MAPNPGPTLLPPGTGVTKDGGVPKIVYPGGPKPEDYPNLAAYNAAVKAWLRKVMPAPGVNGIPFIGGAIGATESVGSFLGKLSDPNTWVRFGEVAVGVICVAVGLSAMTKVNPVAKATKTAAKATVL